MMLPQLGAVEDLAHLRAHVRLREVEGREAMRRLIAIGRASAHALVDRLAEGSDDSEQDERVADELEETLRVIRGRARLE